MHPRQPTCTGTLQRNIRVPVGAARRVRSPQPPKPRHTPRQLVPAVPAKRWISLEHSTVRMRQEHDVVSLWGRKAQHMGRLAVPPVSEHPCFSSCCPSGKNKCLKSLFLGTNLTLHALRLFLKVQCRSTLDRGSVVARNASSR